MSKFQIAAFLILVATGNPAAAADAIQEPVEVYAEPAPAQRARDRGLLESGGIHNSAGTTRIGRFR